MIRMSVGIREARGRGVVILLALLALIVLLVTGCMEKARSITALASSSEPFQEYVGDPVALATVKTVAVLPFDDRSPSPGFKPLEFSTRMANQLAAHGRVKVIYPNEMMRVLEAENLKIRRHNSEYRYRQQVGIKVADERPDQLRRAEEGLRENVAGEEDRRRAYLDPVREANDAVKLARQMGADAVVMGTVTDYDPYMRPRISLFMRVLATGTTEGQAQALADLCQWGIPRTQSMAHGVVWQRQQNFDARDGNIGYGAYMQAITHHVDHNVYDTEAYIASPTLYGDYVGSVLSKALLKARDDAILEAEKRALEEAKRQQMAQAAVRERLQQLITEKPALPDPDQVIAVNHRQQTEDTWRPDVYMRTHNDKAEALYTGGEKPK